MSSSIPDYYRHLAEQSAKDEEEKATGPVPRKKQDSQRRRGASPVPVNSPGPELPSFPYQAQRFTMRLYEDWRDKTVFTIAGPVSDGIQHGVVVLVDEAAEVESLQEFADWQVRSLEEELSGCRILLRGPITLYNGMDAVRVVYVWFPAEDVRFYQEQIYILHDGAAYKLTATFTRKSRKTLGPQVERIMLSFEPTPPPRP